MTTDIIIAIRIVIKFFEVLIILRVLLSWLFIERGNDFVDYVYSLTEPILKIFRFTIPIGMGAGIDFSPVIAIFVLELIEDTLVRLLTI